MEDNGMAEQVDAWERGICARITREREEKGWSQEQLARVVSANGSPMHQTTLGKIEAGKRPLRVSELFSFALAFGIPPTVFMLHNTGLRQSEAAEDLEERLRENATRIEAHFSMLGARLKSGAMDLGNLYAERRVLAAEANKYASWLDGEEKHSMLEGFYASFNRAVGLDKDPEDEKIEALKALLEEQGHGQRPETT